jgi:PAS domain S-box-containing protein
MSTSAIGLLMFTLAGACGVGAYLLERDGRPGWLWAWGALLVAGGLLVLGETSHTLEVLSVSAAGLFPALILRSAFQFAGRRVPGWIVPAGVALGTLRGGLHFLGTSVAETAAAVALEPLAIAAAAIVALRGRRQYAGQLVVLGLFALVAVEFISTVSFLRTGNSPIPFWVLLGTPIGLTQLYSAIGGANHERVEALRAVRERFKQLVEHSSDAIAEVDADGRLTFVSPNVQELLGIDPAQILGRKLPEVIAGLEARWPDSLVEEDSRRSDLIEARLSGMTHRIRDNEGSWHWLETRASPYTDARGELHALSVSRDITEHVRAEEALRASEEQLEAVLSSLSKTRVLLLDREGTIQRSFGDANESVLGAGGSLDIPIDRFLDDRQQKMARALLDSVFEDRKTIEARERLELGTQQGVWQISATPLTGLAGEVSFALVVARNVTDEARAAEEMRALEHRLFHAQKSESLGVLAGGIAHDFNNLLVSILGNLELAIEMEEVQAGSELRGLLEAAELASENAASLTQQLLAYAGDKKVLAEPVDLSQLLRDTIAVTRSAVSEGITFEADAAAGIWTTGDPTQLRQVMMNLITNSGESLEGKGGRIRLETGLMDADEGYLADCYLADDIKPGGFAYLEVADNGSGIAPEALPRIFDPFFTTKFQGRGLGLAGTVGVVRSHGGALRIESELGSGTTIRLLLPYDETSMAAGEAAAREERTDRETTEPSSGTILVVDDDPGVSSMVEALLDQLGYDVVSAGGGRAAVDIFRERHEQIDAVLLDLTMPDLAGNVVLQELRFIRPAVPVVIMSGNSDRHVAEMLEGETGVELLPKPFRKSALRMKIQAAMDGLEA